MTDVIDKAAGETSLQARLAACRKQLSEERQFDIPVPGYDVLFARYAPLDYRIIRRIGRRNEAMIKDPIDMELAIAADTLAAACQGLFEIVEDGEPRALGYRWSTAAAFDLFGLTEAELPQGTTVRDAMFAIFPDNTQLVLHYGEYSEAASDLKHDIDDSVRGESPAA